MASRSPTSGPSASAKPTSDGHRVVILSSLFYDDDGDHDPIEDYVAANSRARSEEAYW